MTNNGRTVGHRNNVKSGYCQSCGLRILVGDPSSGEGMWPAKLNIKPDMMAELMRAAAEFRDLCDEAGEYADAVSFVDWVWPDAVTDGFASPVNLSPEATSARHKVTA
jgi:hypothetical protein